MHHKLGLGYLSDGQRLLNITCLNADSFKVLREGNPASVLQCNRITSYTETARELAVDLSAHTRIDLKLTSIDIDDSISFSNYVRETDYSKSFIYRINAELPESKLEFIKYGEAILTNEAKNLYYHSVDGFRETCGDQLVSSERLGASLYISTKITMATKFEKDSFAIHSSWLLGPVLNFLKLAGDGLNLFFYNQRASLTLAIFQKGGDLSLLREVAQDISFSPSGAVGYLECIKPNDSPTEIDIMLAKCNQIISKLVNYAFQEFPHSISQNPDKYASIFGDSKILYKALGLDIDRRVVTERIIEIRKNLKFIYNDYQTKQDFINKLLSDNSEKYFQIDGVSVGWDYQKSMDKDIINKVRQFNVTINNNLDQIKVLNNYCYDELTKCNDFSPDKNLSLIAKLMQSFAVKSLCGDNLYGPRFLLATNEDTYVEDSKFLKNNDTLSIYTNYHVTNRADNITITLLAHAQNCKLTLERETDYSSIYLYHGQFDRECAKILCPVGDNNYDVAQVEFISTQTPI